MSVAPSSGSSSEPEDEPADREPEIQAEPVRLGDVRMGQYQVSLSLTDTGSRRLEEITEALDAERAHLQERLDGLEF